jgi:hypothetical protein
VQNDPQERIIGPAGQRLPVKGLLMLVAMLMGQGLSMLAADVGWQIKAGGLLTRWATNVSPVNALPDYPRPQMKRAQWLNLNGLWDYAITASPITASAAPPSEHYDGKILVPYPVESALSGVKQGLKSQDTLWYRRRFTIPADWIGPRVLLHFGAVDWAARVFVDGHSVGYHTGGYEPFAFDITRYLGTNAEHELAVMVTNPTESDQPRGKQSLKPGNIFYTSSSGIWQTVWLEPVPETAISDLKLTPDFDSQTIRIQAHVNQVAPDLMLGVDILAYGQRVAATNGPVGSELALALPAMRAWSPTDPFLYRVRVSLFNATNSRPLLDEVESYIGMRKISLQKDAQGATRIALNNQILFQLGALDQGFWPDGIYTAPTDEALASDIRFLKQAGFNLIRKHVKVEPERWYYWCDTLGMLVWQDMPSGDNNIPQSRVEFEAELKHMVADLGNHPSIVQWSLFNEGWGQYDTERLTGWLKRLDPSRLVDNASGWVDHQVGDTVDAHAYPDPEGLPAEKDRASVIGEFGGLGWVVPDHTWATAAWSYELMPSQVGLQVRYASLLNEVFDQRENHALSAAVYTQTADVETECDGLLTYDRSVQKIPTDWLADVNSGALQRRQYEAILPDALAGQPTWQYTLNQPATNWMQPEFATDGWREGKAGFGTPDTAGSVVRTPWTTPDIWLRRSFILDAADLSRARLRVHHDDDVQVYLNGKLALDDPFWLMGYALFDIPSDVLSSLKPGTNTIAVHCHQITGSQYVDVGIVVPRDGM